MKSKALLLGALAVAAVTTAVAQTNPVYSVNAVGYVKRTLGPGFHLIANPLDATTNNSLNSLFPVLPDSSVIYKFNPGGGFDANPPTYIEGFGWFQSGNTNAGNTITLEPGEGAFLSIPPGAGATNVIFAGQVQQGTLTNPIFPGFSIVASKVPQNASLTELGFPGNDNATVYVFDSTTQQYDPNPPTFYTGVGWFPGSTNGPTIPPGSSFFVFLNQGTAASWVRTFNVNQ